MTETNTQPAAVSAEDSQKESSLQEQRGVTVIPAQVVAQIAAQAAYESANVGSNAGGLLGIGARRNFHSRPEAKCDLYGQVAVLHLDLGLTFPTALVSTLQQVREHVSQRVEHFTGLRVEKINIEISWLNPNNQVRRALR
ncbi:Asp23/Gls24 family envelope stress response protein [Rothia dentocariosa]|uniref:Asp23/Gls24 family envelope stress response protein n=1 Tax=Rothia dentocariosa TaxID=2047 RepID=UPI00352CD7AA